MQYPIFSILHCNLAIIIVIVIIFYFENRDMNNSIQKITRSSEMAAYRCSIVTETLSPANFEI